MSRHLFCCAAVLCAVMAAAARAEEPKAGSLPLKKVVLFSSGVGFFEHAGQVTDDAKIEMKFKTDQINDLLKSMVVRDLDGGRVSTVTYGSKDPVTKTLESFAINLTDNPTLAKLLGQIRGERVVVEAPNEITGIILGLETRKKQIGQNETIEIDVLNLLTDQGLRSVELASVSRIKLANEQLDAELRKALAVLASSHSTDKKSVELGFLGKGARRVKVGYVQAMPIWKTTYRLVLTDNKKPYLQGWAIVENTTEADWSSVNLTLVSGRPISFTMDLYEPLYLNRPNVELELFASLRPQSYGQDLMTQQSHAINKPAWDMKRSLMKGMRAKAEGIARTQTAAQAPMEMAGGMGGAEADGELNEVSEPFSSGVQSSANAGEIGNLFQYSIATPVTLPRQQSAMLPIASAEIAGEKVSIYNPSVLAKHPLYGLEFTNTTDLHLMQGPITVFDGGVYAGDAKVADVPPGGKRLISYGVDLDVEVAPQTKAKPEELLSVRLLKGTLLATRKYVRTFEYTVKNSGKHAKNVLIEVPIDPNWTLVSPKKPTEKTRDLYRFAVEAKPNEPAKLVVEQERTDRQQIMLTNLDDATIQFYMSAKVVDEKVKAALAELVRRKAELQQVVAERQRLEQRIAQIGDDQNRIRQNMAQLDRASDVYKSYVKKFSDQEGEIERLRSQITTLVERETKLRQSADEFLIKLDL